MLAHVSLEVMKLGLHVAWALILGDILLYRPDTRCVVDMDFQRRGLGRRVDPERTRQNLKS